MLSLRRITKHQTLPPQEQHTLMNNPSTHKLKRKSFLKKSDNHQHARTPLRELNGNAPKVTIDLARASTDALHIEPILKCKKELSLQKTILLKELEKKEQKIQKLRRTFRKIQTSKSKTLLNPDPPTNPKNNTLLLSTPTRNTAHPTARSPKRQSQRRTSLFFSERQT